MSTLREQFLERLTRAFFQKAGSGFVLKGGGALRALYGGQRLTKDIDLDFTNPKRSAESLHNTVRRAITAAARGLPLRDLQVREPGKAEQLPRWKLNFHDPAGAEYHVEIEVSRDPARAPPGRIVQKPFVPLAAKGIARFWVDIYDEPTLIASKIAALLGRDVPRDVYDLDLLHQQHESPTAEQVAWAVTRAGLGIQDARATLWQHLAALSWERFQTELQGALPADVAARLDENEWTATKQRVGDYVQALLAGLPQ